MTRFGAFSEREAAEPIGVSVHTMRFWRRQHHGPSFCKIAGYEGPGRGRAGRVFYRSADAEALLAGVGVETVIAMSERVRRVV